MSFTADFIEFRKRIESLFGNIEFLAKDEPDIYCHQVLAHGFMEYALVKGVSLTKENFMVWIKENKLEESLIEKGWKELEED